MMHGFLRRLFEIFERHRTSVDVVTTSEVSVSVTVDDERRLPAIVAELSVIAEVSCEPEMAIICAVGEEMRHDQTMIGRIFAAVGNVPIHLVSQAGSRRNITFVIREADLPATLGRLHDRFFSPLSARHDEAAARPRRSSSLDFARDDPEYVEGSQSGGGRA